MPNHRVKSIDFAVRDGIAGEWDRGIVTEVVSGDCYRIGSWTPNNPVRILDVGAHIGSFAKWTATRLPQASVWAFEMMPENFDLLSRNIASLANVRATHVALGDRSGHVQQEALSDNTGGTAVNWSSSGAIQAIDIADVFSEWPYIDCLKMDCEGSEFPIIRKIMSMPGGLQARVGCIRAEVHGPRHSIDRADFMAALSRSFPYTTESWTGDGTSLVFGWR